MDTSPDQDRTLAADGLVNARDLGGLPLRTGGRTPMGVFFRSENVDSLTEAGWEQLFAAGIRTVVDLRQPAERAKDSSQRPDWLTTREVDLDGLENTAFWADYWDNGLVGTALYFLPHLSALPERAGAALQAIVTADDGGVLFHCLGGRDRTGMLSMLLLSALDVEPEAIVDDYLETVRRGDARAANTGSTNDEVSIDEFCIRNGSSTEGAFRAALAGLDLDGFLGVSGLNGSERVALRTWRGSVPDAAEAPGIVIRTTSELDWQHIRALRVENATDNPISYGATLETTLGMDEEAWRLRGRRGEVAVGAVPATTVLAAIQGTTGRWIGMMSCQIGDEDGAGAVLTGVYVSPDFRGRTHRIADALLSRIEAWAAPLSSTLRLYVYEGAPPALSFYRRQGFSETGRTRAQLIEPGGRQLEMIKDLRG